MNRRAGRVAVALLAIASCAAPYAPAPTHAHRKYGSSLLTPSGGTIVGVTAGSGLTGGGVAGNVTVNVGAGSGVIVAADTVSADTSYVQKRIGGSCIGANAIQTVNADGSVVCVAAGGGGGGGTVTSVGTGTGLTGGPITTTGTVSLANTAVTAGNYTLPAITVDAQGRLTAASSYAGTSCGAGTAIQLLSTAGAASCVTVGTGTVTSVSTTAPITGGPFTTSGTIGINESSNLRTNAGALDLSTAVVMPGSLKAKDLAGTSQTVSTTGLTDDVALSSSTTVIDYTGTADASWGGFVSTGDSRWVYIDNATTHVITLVDKDSSTTAADQIKVPEVGSDGFQIPGNSGTWIHYDASSSLWRLSGLVQTVCNAGQFVERVNPDGSAVCSTPTGTGVAGSGTTGDLMAWSGATAAGNFAGSTCGAGTAATGIGATGALTCGITPITGTLTGARIPVALSANTVGDSDITNASGVTSILDDTVKFGSTHQGGIYTFWNGSQSEIDADYASNTATTLILNGHGYNGGTTQKRTVWIEDGTTGLIMQLAGSNKEVDTYGPTTLSSAWSSPVLIKGEPKCSGTTPTVTGTGATIAGTNCSGTVTLGGSGLGAFTINWDASHPWTNTPPCTLTWIASSNVAVWISSQSTTALAVKLASTGIGAVNYQCGWGY